MQTGLDRARKDFPRRLKTARIGLLVHPASVNKRLVHALHVFLGASPLAVSAIFGPQHGIYGETQDNMIEWEGFRDPKTGLRVYSLYGKTRKPSRDMLEEIDVMVIDLQDVGARYYTFIWTMDFCMEACMEAKKAIVILDRPNPLGGLMTEGPVLDERFSSFVGRRPLPVRHGMTIGEIGMYLRDRYYRSLDLTVIAMRGWRRSMWFDETGHPWVMPSPNMPTLDTATVYPGMCLLEGTNMSEGRGTTRPFELFGAPYIDPDRLLRRLCEYRLPGVTFRPAHFEPTFQKHRGVLCGGAQIHVTDRRVFKPWKTGVAILKVVRELYPKEFAWNSPPYEYEYEKMPIDILAGTDRLRRDIESGVPLELMEARWREECARFDTQVRTKYLIYD